MPKRVAIDLVLAKRLWADGKSAAEIGKVFGVSDETIRRKLDIHHGSRGYLGGGDGSGYRASGNAEEVHALTVAPDTRTWQQRFFGDPLPSRSALGREPQDGRPASRKSRAEQV